MFIGTIAGKQFSFDHPLDYPHGSHSHFCGLGRVLERQFDFLLRLHLGHAPAWHRVDRATRCAPAVLVGRDRGQHPPASPALEHDSIHAYLHLGCRSAVVLAAVPAQRLALGRDDGFDPVDDHAGNHGLATDVAGAELHVTGDGQDAGVQLCPNLKQWLASLTL